MTGNAENDARDLCIACGFCCDGTLFRKTGVSHAERARMLEMEIFADCPEVDEGDPAALLVDQGNRPETWMPQPCAALAEGGCGIYAVRPKVCRNFECLLLPKVKRGLVPLSEALDVVANIRTLGRDVEDLRALRRGNEGDEKLIMLIRLKRQAIRHYQNTLFRRKRKAAPGAKGATVAPS
jgi:Fe-S-cluster containining protein